MLLGLADIQSTRGRADQNSPLYGREKVDELSGYPTASARALRSAETSPPRRPRVLEGERYLTSRETRTRQAGVIGHSPPPRRSAHHLSRSATVFSKPNGPGS